MVVTKKIKSEEKEKVFTLPGQKHEAPEVRDPLRIFYESLHKQRPNSEMAELWLMEHGLLSPERAKEAFEKKQQRRRGKASASKVIEGKGKKQEEPDPQAKEYDDN